MSNNGRSGGKGGGFGNGNKPPGRGGRGGTSGANSRNGNAQAPRVVLQRSSFSQSLCNGPRKYPPSVWEKKELTEADIKPPRRKGPGNLNMAVIKIQTNHVQAFLNCPDRIFHYDISLSYAERNSEKKGRTSRPGSATQDEIKPKLWKKVVQKLLPMVEERHEKLANGRGDSRGSSSLRVASDYSKALYTPIPLLGILEDYTVKLETTEFKVAINETRSVFDTAHFKSLVNDLKDKDGINMAEAEQIYNIVLKTEAMKKFVNIGRSAFFDVSTTAEYGLGGGLVNMSGFSLIYTFGWKPYINVDVANAVFIKGGSVLEVIHDIFGIKIRGDLDCRDVSTWHRHPGATAKVNNVLRGCLVSYYQNGNQIKKRVKDVLAQRPEDCEFEMGNKKTNVYEYFKAKKHTFTEMDKKGPCLVFGSKPHQSIVPAVFCCVEKGNPYTKNLSTSQTGDMIKNTAIEPKIRKARIMKSIQTCDFKNDEVLTQFGLDKEKSDTRNLIEFKEARVLPTPEIVYCTNGAYRAEVSAGEWKLDGTKFMVPAIIRKWSVCYIRRATKDEMSQNTTNDVPPTREQEMLQFINVFRSMGEVHGLIIPNCILPFNFLGFHPDPEYIQIFESKLLKRLESSKQNDETFVLVVIPEKNHMSYGITKRLAELVGNGSTGVVTQCVTQENMLKKFPATIVNILQKLNAKLDGTTHGVNVAVNPGLSEIDIFTSRILFLGADVTHPAANSTMPSIAAVTGSFDAFGMKYTMIPQLQKKADRGAAEIIENLAGMVETLIRNYKDKTLFPPRKIVYLRDGVGDGQYAEVLRKELLAIRAACTKLSPNLQPKITFVVVQKRHKTRFFVSDEKDGVGSSRNAPPGTVIDTEIVHPTETDFYLLSHKGIQGTSRPTRYHILWDDSDFSADELQNLTYGLCHAYARCSRSVSIPAPTYYAHLAAYRVRVQIESMGSELDKLSKEKLTEEEQIKRMNKLVQRNVELTKNYPMHFV